MSEFRVGSARRRRNTLLRDELTQAAVRTILAGCANDTGFAFRQSMVRRRAGSASLATQASWRLFYGPCYVGVCRATAAESVTHP